MNIAMCGMDLYRNGGCPESLDTIREHVQRAHSGGFNGYWLPQTNSMDALTILASVGSGVDVPMGVAVVPVYTRHPVALAQQALTVNKALNGNLTLGVGASDRFIVERVWGQSFDRPVAYMSEYLEILLLLLEEREAYMRGKRVFMRGELDIEGPACSVIMAALGPRMLELAGRVAAGAMTWMTGPKTIRDFTVPTINKAAEAAERDAPEVIVSLPVCVTDDAEGAKALANELLAKWEQAPACRDMLDREGLSSAGDICVIGNEDQVAERLAVFFAAGATKVVVVPAGTDEEIERTWEAMAALVA